MQNSPTNPHWLLSDPIAHRGLHGEDCPENSITSFQKAIDFGYPIEIDVQMTKDCVPVVFHDSCLKRLCGVRQNISEICFADLTKLKVLGSEPIPSLHQVLELVDNQVPILVEIKNEKLKNADLHQSVLKELKIYEGRYAVQSFHPSTVSFFKGELDVPVGLLSCSYKDEDMSFLKKQILKNNLSVFVKKPDFISYKWDEVNGLVNHILHQKLEIPFIAWTLKAEDEVLRLSNFCHNYIFEAFCP